jgi:hypothetical protein
MTPAVIRFAMAVAVAAAVALAACGQADDNLEAGEPSGDLAEFRDRDDGLWVALTGPISGNRICPGDVRPCIVLDGDLAVDDQDPDPTEAYRVVGSLADGVLTVEYIERRPGSLDWITDRCPDEGKKTESEFLAEFALDPETMMEESGATGEDELGGDTDVLGLYQLEIADVYAVRWISPRQVIHLGVVGDAEPHRQALETQGLGDFVCVVGGFKRSDAELEAIQSEIPSLVEEWPAADGWWGASRDPERGAVAVDLYQADAGMLADTEEHYSDAVILDAAILVLNGSVADFEKAADSTVSNGDGGDVDPSDSLGLTASCGPVIFPSIPPDPDAFEPVDDEIQALLDEMATGPLSVETAEFVPAYRWQVASRSDDKIVLFGRRIEGEAGYGGDYADIRFERRGEAWTAAGWGGCNIEIDAPGFGSATTVLDPDHEPDPDSTELHLLINERECASGQPPTDREVLPVVIETETSIEIVTLVEPVVGGADCQSNPWHPITVTLNDPLGERIVYDGQMPPPVALTWPPDPERYTGE